MAFPKSVQRQHQRWVRWCCLLPFGAGAFFSVMPFALLAQTTVVSLSRAEAVRMAAEHSPRLSLARADSALATAGLQLARQFENPRLNSSYSKAAPQAHFSLEVPIEWPVARHARISASESDVAAAKFRRANERAALELDVDTAYSRAQALAARSMLSARIARDADSLLILARIRRDAGDASDLDVELAVVFAGQNQNIAVNDSIAAIASRAVLQALLGLSIDSVRVTLSETIVIATLPTMERVTIAPAPVGGARDASVATSSSYSVAAAERDLDAANFRVLVEQRRRLPAPSLTVGFEAIDVGQGSGLFPTAGFAVPFPIFNRNAASIQVARAERERARVSVSIVKLERALRLSNSVREAQAAQARSVRSSQLVASANRIAALSLVAYREGASALSAVLDAQRAARESLAQYVDDVATSRIADSVLRFYTFTSVVPPQ